MTFLKPSLSVREANLEKKPKSSNFPKTVETFVIRNSLLLDSSDVVAEINMLNLSDTWYFSTNRLFAFQFVAFTINEAGVP